MKPVLFIDLETIPAQTEIAKAIVTEGVKPPGNIKKQETIDKWHRESKDAAIEKSILETSFDGLAGEIIVIGYAINDEPEQVIYRKNCTETEMLQSFFNAIQEQSPDGTGLYTWCGHNAAKFDLPFLFKRCLVNRVMPPIDMPRNPKAWDSNVFDTLFEITGDIKTGGSLDRICKLLGIGQKTQGMSGDKVWPEYQRGNIEKIANYCKDDVQLTREIYKRIQFSDSVVRTDIRSPFKAA